MLPQFTKRELHRHHLNAWKPSQNKRSSLFHKQTLCNCRVDLPGALIGRDGAISTIRLENAREGVEDYEYLYRLQSLITRAKAAGRDASNAERALSSAAELVEIPNAGGRFSSKILPEPQVLEQVRTQVAKAIESLD
jgi:hypothetical protein